MFGLSWGILNNSEGLCWINLIGFLIIHANLIPYLLICFTVTLEVFLKMIFQEHWMILGFWLPVNVNLIHFEFSFQNELKNSKCLIMILP